MSITLSGVTTSTAAGTLNVSLPSHVAGDVLIVCAGVQSGLLTVDTSGWTILAEIDEATYGSLILTKVASSDSESLTLGAGRVSTVSFKASSAFSVYDFATDVQTSALHTFSEVSTNVDSLILGFLSGYGINPTPGSSFPSNMTVLGSVFIPSTGLDIVAGSSIGTGDTFQAEVLDTTFSRETRFITLVIDAAEIQAAKRRRRTPGVPL